MIQEVNAFSSRSNLSVLRNRNAAFKGTESKDVNCKGGKLPKASAAMNRAFEKKLAVANAGGMSAAAAVLTTVIARSYTATRRNAGLFGVGAGLITMMFLCPRNLYKAGINTFKDNLKA